MPPPRDTATQMHDAIIIGGGLAGIYALYTLRTLGLSVRVLEAGAGVGGTWYHNRYPGARCDIESLDYSYSFSEDLQQEWHWSERYASQPEILRYINHVVDRFGLAQDIYLGTTAVSAAFDEDVSRWRVTTDNGLTFCAKYAIMATGVLSVPQIPDTPGLDTFKGPWHHSGDWPHDGVDVSGKRVGVIGTGSSGTQMIPIIAEQADQLYVFQRTANFCMPAQNRPMVAEIEQQWKASYPEKRAFARASGFGHNQVTNPKSGKDVSAEERQAELENRWQLGGLYMMRAFRDIMVDKDVNDEASNFVRGKIRNIVQNPKTAETLSPSGLPIGTKRLCSGTGYYETFNRPNVTLVDVVAEPIERVVPHGVRTSTGDYELDVLIYATGFDAMTGALNRLNPSGRHGRQLRQHWAHGPRTYLGLTVAGFPNLFIIAGPGSPSVFSNMVTSIEQHVEWVANAIRYLDAHALDTIEASPEAESEWVIHVNDLASRTLYREAKNTWFYGANTPGKPVVFMPYVGGVGKYSSHINDLAASGYSGFLLEAAKAAPPIDDSDTSARN